MARVQRIVALFYYKYMRIVCFEVINNVPYLRVGSSLSAPQRTDNTIKLPALPAIGDANDD